MDTSRLRIYGRDNLRVHEREQQPHMALRTADTLYRFRQSCPHHGIARTRNGREPSPAPV